jgi:hypothetical protein
MEKRSQQRPTPPSTFKREMDEFERRGRRETQQHNSMIKMVLSLRKWRENNSMRRRSGGERCDG